MQQKIDVSFFLVTTCINLRLALLRFIQMSHVIVYITMNSEEAGSLFYLTLKIMIGGEDCYYSYDFYCSMWNPISCKVDIYLERPEVGRRIFEVHS